MFQSTPAISGGRTVIDIGTRGPQVAVSIHARHLWRANRSVRCKCDRVSRFQSTPAISGGRTRRSGRVEFGADRVSIHARHLWRANLGALRPDCAYRCFNPRPPSLAGEPTSRQVRAPTTMFQSTPAISGGRTGLCRNQGLLDRCFNPRPPSLAGEPIKPWTKSTRKKRFNPRPPSLAGEPADDGNRQAAGAFQSTPAISGGRTHQWPLSPANGGCFNPRPPSLAGEPGPSRQPPARR